MDKSVPFQGCEFFINLSQRTGPLPFGLYSLKLHFGAGIGVHFGGADGIADGQGEGRGRARPEDEAGAHGGDALELIDGDEQRGCRAPEQQHRAGNVVRAVAEEPGQRKQVQADDGGGGREGESIPVQLVEGKVDEGDQHPLRHVDALEGLAHGGIFGGFGIASGGAQQPEAGGEQGEENEPDGETGAHRELLADVEREADPERSKCREKERPDGSAAELLCCLKPFHDAFTFPAVGQSLI